MELRATATGQTGIFFEQLPMWRWLEERVRGAARPLEVLNLFAHTGGSTLAVAKAGARVVHVDGLKSAVAGARRNAELNGIDSKAIRWMVEDVRTFVRREQKRGRGYDAVILDPPSYGHGPDREPWKIEEHLPELLSELAALTERRRAFVLLTTHTPGYDGDRLGDELRAALGKGPMETGSLDLAAQSGNVLPSGSFARCWSAPSG
jgi:23S rRNA (cytosine1962-C5)-methyltransferase